MRGFQGMVGEKERECDGDREEEGWNLVRMKKTER